MSFNLYASTDDGAPTLPGQADSLNNLLKACLVDGYGAKAAAGWTAPYYDSATKQRVFLTAGSPAAYLLVQDNGQSVGGLREARIFGYESMSAHNAGIGQFPTAAQRPTGYCIRKSATADATPRKWWLLADGQRFHLFIETGDANANAVPCHFGKFKSYKPNDDHAFLIVARTAENSTSYNTASDPAIARNNNLITADRAHVMRTYTGVGSATMSGLITDSAKSGITSTIAAGTSGMPYPMPVDGGLYMAKTYITETGIVRGELPGIWCPLHNRPLAHEDTFTGVEGLTGRSFMCLWGPLSSCLFLETSDTLDV